MKHTITRQSELHHAFDAREFSAGYGVNQKADPVFRAGRDYALDEMDALLPLLGIGISAGAQAQIAQGVGMDAIQAPVTTASIGQPMQYLQAILPGIVEIVTAARKIDEILGVNTAGSWEHEQVVQEVLENTGAAAPYGDDTVIPLSNYNLNFVYRTIVRFEQGMRVGNLEEARAAAVNVNAGAQKRRSAALLLETARNQIGFYGYNNGANLTYGLLNDPSLPAYVNVANSGTLWAAKTFLQIQADLLTAFQTLRVQTQEAVDPGTTPITLTIATACVDYLRKTSDYGISIIEWLNKAYPNVRIVSAPQYNAANGGSNVFTLHAETVADSGTDDQKSIIQVVPAKFLLLGMQKGAKYYEEDYSNATAGAICKRPFAVVRYTSI